MLVKVKFKSFTTLGQANLLIYAKRIVSKMTSNETYAPYAGEVSKLQDAIVAFEQAIEDQIPGLKTTTTIKDNRKTDLLNIMRNLGTRLTLDANDDANFILNAGYDVQQQKKKENLEELPAPTISEAKSTGERRELMVVVNPNITDAGIKEFAFEYSTDNLQTWTNGNYSTKLKTVFKNLPATLNMNLRVRSIGTRGRVSPWSEPVVCGVL